MAKEMYMHKISQQRFLSALLIAIIVTFPIATRASSSPALLPANTIVPLSISNKFFPEVTKTASSGQNSTVSGHPKATRIVIYVNNDDSKKITISVDQYASSNDASSANKEAVEKSKLVRGFKPLSVPKLGQQSLAGTVTQGSETHIGLGILDGKLIVGVTLAGYELTPLNIAKLVDLARMENTTAIAALSE
jgi:hypothetical protein